MQMAVPIEQDRTYAVLGHGIEWSALQFYCDPCGFNGLRGPTSLLWAGRQTRHLFVAPDSQIDVE